MHSTKRLFGFSWLPTILRTLAAAASVLLIWITSMLLIEALGLL